jgi:hypothetical protein
VPKQSSVLQTEGRTGFVTPRPELARDHVAMDICGVEADPVLILIVAASRSPSPFFTGPAGGS